MHYEIYTLRWKHKLISHDIYSTYMYLLVIYVVFKGIKSKCLFTAIRDVVINRNVNRSLYPVCQLSRSFLAQNISAMPLE